VSELAVEDLGRERRKERARLERRRSVEERMANFNQSKDQRKKRSCILMLRSIASVSEFCVCVYATRTADLSDPESWLTEDP